MLIIRRVFCDAVRKNRQKRKENDTMAKDSQPDNKEARERKCHGQTPLTRENQNRSRTAKKQSARRGDV